MSCQIDYQFAAIALPITPDFREERTILLLIAETGSDNVTEMVWRGTRHYECRERSWVPIALGSPWEAMTEVVERAASCEGGMLAVPGKLRCTLPETYIRRWRAAVEQPFTMQEVALAGISITADIAIAPEMLDNDGRRNSFARLRNTRPSTTEGARVSFNFDLSNPDDVRVIRDNYFVAGSHWPAYRWFKVKGPREATIVRVAAPAVAA